MQLNAVLQPLLLQMAKQNEEKREIVIFTPDHTTFYKTSYEILKKNIYKSYLSMAFF